MRKHLVVFAQPRTSDEVQEGAFRRLLNSSGGPNLHRTHIKQLCFSRGQNDEGRHNHRDWTYLSAVFHMLVKECSLLQDRCYNAL
jgi:hypothetical protein